MKWDDLWDVPEDARDPVVLIDCGIGNVASVANMLRKVGARVVRTDDPETVRRQHRLILPGVGAFDAGMKALQDRGLDEAVREAVAGGALALGICLGFQLLMEGSEEGSREGLGLISGRARRFDASAIGLKVPHMGWNTVTPRPGAALFPTDADELRYYFVHSFYVECDGAEDVSATCEYGLEFVCAVERSRVMGVQFHPEKSHRFGVQLFERFCAFEC